MSQFRLRVSEDGQRWCWLLVAGGRVLAVSEMFESRDLAEEAIAEARRAAPKAALVEADGLPLLEAIG